MEEDRFRIPVPNYIRTRRTAPRVIALLVLIAWAGFFAAEGPALARVATGPSVLAQPIELGTKLWRVIPNAGPRTAGSAQQAKVEDCAGVFRMTTAATKSEASLQSSALFHLHAFNSNTLARFSSDAKFDELNELQDLTVKISLEPQEGPIYTGGSVRLHVGKRDEPVDVTLRTLGWKQTFKLPYPGRIYMAPVSKGRYRLYLPAELRSRFENNAFAQKLPFAAFASTEEQVAECEQLLERTGGAQSAAVKIEGFNLSPAQLLQSLPVTRNLPRSSEPAPAADAPAKSLTTTEAQP